MAIGQHTCCNKQKVKRGLWSPEEDEKLISCIITYGHGSWSNVPKLAGLQRCGKSCRLRWINYLRPDLRRGSFSPQEASLIIELHKILGNRWAQIAKHLPGRTDNEVKNFWNSSLKKKLSSQGGDWGYSTDHQQVIIPHTFVYPNPNHHQGNFYNFNNNANLNLIIPPAAAAALHHEQGDHEIIPNNNQQQLPLYVPYLQAPMPPLQGFNLQHAGGAGQNDHHEQMMMMNNNSDFDGMQINNPRPPAAVPQPAGFLRVGVPVSAVVPPPAVPVLPAVINSPSSSSSAVVQDHDQQLATWAMSSTAQFHQSLFNSLKQEFFDNYSAGKFTTTMVPPPAASAMPNQLAHDQTIAGPALTLPEMDDMDDFSHFSPQEDMSDHDDPIGNDLSSPDDHDLPSDDRANFSHYLHVPSDHMDYIDDLMMSSFPSTSSSSSPSSASSSLSPLSYSQFDVNDTIASSSWD